MAALKSRRSFASRLPSLSSRGKLLSRQGFSATAARHLGDIQVTMQNAPLASKAPRTSASPRGPVECPKQFASPHVGPSVSFSAPQEVEMSATASEGESKDQADVSAGRCPSAVAAPSEADAKLSAMLLRAAKEIGLEVPKISPADPSRLDVWFLGRAYHAAGQAATALHAMATLQVYQAQALKHLHEGGPDQGAMQELRAATDFALWVTKMADVDKARFLDAPISQGGLFGDTFSAVQKQTEVLKHIFSRRDSATTSAGPQPPPARCRGRPPAAPKTPAPPTGAARASGTGQEHPQQSCEAGGGDCSLGDDNIYVPTPGGGPGAASISSPLGDALPPQIRTRRSISPAREPGKKTFLQDVLPSGISCPTVVTSVNAPLIPLATRLGAWLQLPSPSQWLIRTVRLGYAIQFARHPPRYRGVLFTSVHSDTHAAVLRAEIAVLLAKDAIEPVPPAEMKSGFYSPYFIVPKKSGGLIPILDLRALNRSLLRLPFKMLTTKRMLTCIRHQDWFAAIDLKDAYFHVSILPRHRPFLRFAFEGRAYQYKVLPFGLFLSLRVFTRVTEAALSPLWRMGIRILNYLDDWLLIAHSQDVLCEHRDLVLRHLSHLGLQVNREKSKLSPVQRISFSVPPHQRARAVSAELSELIQTQDSGPSQNISEAPGAYGSCSRGDAAGLASYETASALVTRSSPEMGMAPWHTPDWRFPATRPFFRPEHLVVYTDASSTGWGAVCNGQAASGSWTGPRLQWHINCLELLAVLLALRRFRLMLRHKHVLVRTDSTATVAYINHQGGLRSRRMSQLAHHLLLWSQTWLKSLRAVHIPGELNRAADQLSRQSTHPGEWRLHPQVVQLIWSHFGEAQIDLFASPESSHCQLFYSLSEAPLGRDALAHSWPPGAQVRLSPSEPPCTDTVQDQGGRGAGSAGCAILALPNLVSRPHFPCGSPSLEDPLEERPSFSGDGHNLAPASRPMEPARLAPGRDTSDLSGLSQAVIDTITQSRAPSTRQAYALRWGLFVDWCSSRGEDPQRCRIAVVLSFLQEKLERRLSPSTLKVYVAAIAAYHNAVDGASLGKHQLVVRFLRGARRVNPPRLHLVPSWDLAITLRGLREAPFEPLASVELKYLSLKTALLTALASIKRVGDLQAFSVDETCLEFGPGDSHVILRPRPGYVPKVPTTPFRDQVVNLQALPLEEADPASALLCPVRSLRIYMDRTRHFRCTEQLFVCFGGQQKGNAVSKQRLAHWVVDAISLSYQNQGEPCPLGVRAHSTRSVASSYALAHGASLADICRAAGWATPNTFARFYNLRVEAVSS
ncbi:hypothetical protein M9458_055394, partial [Cirrhinus mrigala]